jgi:hypothetical protein
MRGTHIPSHLIASTASCFLDLLLVRPRRLAMKPATFVLSVGLGILTGRLTES